VIHLRLVVPESARDDVVCMLRNDPGVTNLILLPGAGLVPAGDVVLCDVAREVASVVLRRLRDLGVDAAGGIAIEEIDASVSHGALRAEQAAPGSPDDAIVWELVESRARADARASWSFFAFLTLATMLAAVAVLTDSAVLVVGAMVVGPEFGTVAAAAVALVLDRPTLLADAARLLVVGFAVAVALTAGAAALGHLAGWFSVADLTAERPLTAFIWRPDRWSVLVALRAGAAGALSLASGRSTALVGVFISVTTVPAAGNLAVALALWVPQEMLGSLAQLGVNLLGMTVAGTAVLAVQRLVTVRLAGRWPTRRAVRCPSDQPA
jgi:uncharacterized hydrophobic protein (TIGR00271 family)